MSSVVQLRPSRAEKPTVAAGREKNEAYRAREYLTEAEIEQLLEAAGKSRNPVRDRLLILLAFRHALRVRELVDVKVEQLDLKAATIHIARAKNGTPGQGDELRLIRALLREQPNSSFLFLSERKAPLSIDGAQKLVERLGEAAGFTFPIHLHMLRHSAGYALASRGVDTQLTSINQYWLHYRLLDNWGYKALAKGWRKESIEEMEHADKLTARITFLAGFPNMQVLDPLRIGQNVKEVIECDLQSEMSARALYEEAATHCHSVKDYVSRNLFEELMHEEEDHIDFLETQIDLIAKLGVELYAQHHIGKLEKDD